MPVRAALTCSVLHSDFSSSERRYRYSHAKSALLICVAASWSAPAASHAADLLVVDRLSNGVYRYNQSGQLLGVVTQEVVPEGQEPIYLNQPTGIGISPDYTKLYVSSSQHNHVVTYDYNRFTGTA